MKLICSKENLLKGINTVMKAVPGKTTMPILECILIEAYANCIKFTANDMDLAIETVVEGSVVEKGTIALEAKLFSEIVRKLPDNEVTIETAPNFATKIVCEKAKFSIMGKDGDEFARIPIVERNEPLELSQFILKEMIRQTIFSIGNGESNKVMSGEYLEVNENTMRMTALDGHRIAMRRTMLKNYHEAVSAIIPGKTLNEISKIFGGELDQSIMVYFTPNHVMFEFDQTIVVSRLIEGQYFSVDKMISHDYVTKVSINRRDYLDCLDRAILLVRENDKKPIILTIEDGVVDLRIDSQMGSMNETISIEKEGKDLKIGFNPRLMSDAVRVIEDETIDMYFVNSKSPCFIRNEENSYTYLVLPVNFV